MVNSVLSSLMPNYPPEAAPSVNSMVWTTAAVGKYTTFNGTSAAAPHVSGAVGLLMSYMNDTTGANNYKNLAPEDCEYIIQHSATDVNTPGYDQYTGYGRLNAGAALRMVEKPVRILYHFGTNPLTPHTITKSVYSNSDTVVLTERYWNYQNPKKLYPPGKYLVKIFQINAIVSHPGFYPTDSLMHKWPRHSSSYVYDLPDAQKRLNLHEHLKINSCTHSNASLTGYVYEVWDSVGVQSLGWWPCDTSFSALFVGNSAPKTLMEYSILSKNKAVGISKNTKDAKNVTIYPNPANLLQTLVIKSEKISACTVEVYDIMGRFIKSIYSGKTNIGNTFVIHNTENLPNSMYLYIIKIDDEVLTKKFIKE